MARLHHSQPGAVEVFGLIALIRVFRVYQGCTDFTINYFFGFPSLSTPAMSGQRCSKRLPQWRYSKERGAVGDCRGEFTYVALEVPNISHNATS